ncbi:recombination regulator RecX [Nonomuraea endophytica]|uniref:recombination regulator RecX n=1 Tax=Nonomuraea endophytica TaxID=714136 RepID=UPI0037CC254D
MSDDDPARAPHPNDWGAWPDGPARGRGKGSARRGKPADGWPASLDEVRATRQPPTQPAGPEPGAFDEPPGGPAPWTSWGAPDIPAEPPRPSPPPEPPRPEAGTEGHDRGFFAEPAGEPERGGKRGSRRGGRSGRGAKGSRSSGRGGRRRSEDGSGGGWLPDGPDEGSGAAAGPPANPEAVARAVCLRMLTLAPKTRAQLAEALRKREIPEEAADAVLDRFTELGLINDEAFAEAWVDSRHHGRGLARRALAAELRHRGVDNDTVKDAVERLDPDQEAETARRLVDRKLSSTRGLDPQVRTRRLAGMLARKGYSGGLAFRVIREALEQEGVEIEDDFS